MTDPLSGETIYVLTEAAYYYPSPGSDDWIGIYNTREAADAAFDDVRHKHGTVTLIAITGTAWENVRTRDTDDDD